MDAVVKEEENGIDVKKEVKIEQEDDSYQNFIEPKQEVIDELLELIEPKVELIDVKIEKNGEYQDYDGQHDAELQPVNKATYERRTKRMQCRKCGKWIVSSHIQTTRQHAVIHTNFYRFECGAESCDFRRWRKYLVENHVENKHNGNMKYVKERKLTEEEDQELNNMVNECFPNNNNSHQQHIPYEYLDNENRTDDNGLSKQKRKRRAAGPLMGERRRQCQKCGKVIVVDGLVTAEQHAATHTNFKKFECEICGQKTWLVANIRRHVKKLHGSSSGLVKEIELTEEEKLEVGRMVEECFPGVIKQTQHHAIPDEEIVKKIGCQKCGKMIRLGCFQHAESHAATHTDLKRFECDQCDFKSWHREHVTRHEKKSHNTGSCSVKSIPLTEDQKMEFERIVNECFPGVTNNQSSRSMVKDVKIEEDDTPYFL